MDALMKMFTWNVVFAIGYAHQLSGDIAAKGADSAVAYLESRKPLTLSDGPGAPPPPIASEEEAGVLRFFGELLADERGPVAVEGLKRKIAAATGAPPPAPASPIGAAPEGADAAPAPPSGRKLPDDLRALIAEVFGKGAPSDGETSEIQRGLLEALERGLPGHDPHEASTTTRTSLESILPMLQSILASDMQAKVAVERARADHAGHQMATFAALFNAHAEHVKSIVYALTEPKGFWHGLVKAIRGRV
jgi:hypothetical protein